MTGPALGGGGAHRPEGSGGVALGGGTPGLASTINVPLDGWSAPVSAGLGPVLRRRPRGVVAFPIRGSLNARPSAEGVQGDFLGLEKNSDRERDVAGGARTIANF